MDLRALALAAPRAFCLRAAVAIALIEGCGQTATTGDGAAMDSPASLGDARDTSVDSGATDDAPGAMDTVADDVATRDSGAMDDATDARPSMDVLADDAPAPRDSSATDAAHPDAMHADAAVTPARDPYYWPHASSSPFNLGLGSGAVYAPMTSAITQSLHTYSGSTPAPALAFTQYSYPMIVAHASDPLETIAIAGCFTDRGAGGTATPASCAPMHSYAARVPTTAMPDPSREGHMPVMQPDGFTQIQGYQWTGGPGMWSASRLTVWDTRGPGIASTAGQQWGTRASGVSDIAGMVRCWEIAKVLSGEWDAFPHALAVDINGSQLAHAATQPGTYVWPATMSDGFWTRYAGAVPMGSLLAIPRTTPRPALRNAVSTALWNTLVRYGGYVVDQTGAPFSITVEPRCDAATIAVLQETDSFDRPLTSRDLYVMWQDTTVITNNSATTVNGGGTYAQSPAPPLVPLLGVPYTGAFTP